jgi:ryanodine receptor 2
MTYIPRPIDTSSVQLPAELAALTERLAEHAHDLWAAQRIHDGWTYGPARNDQLKQHPSLVPYAELTDAEKEYDRITAVGTLKAILQLGYRISAGSTPVGTA